MTRRPGRRRLLLALLLAGTTACSETVDTATRVRDCAGLAREVASAGLGAAPSAVQAEEVARRLGERVDALAEGDVKTAASTLRDRLQELATAARSGDQAAVRTAAESARAAAEDAARTCGLPVDQFVQAAQSR